MAEETTAVAEAPAPVEAPPAPAPVAIRREPDFQSDTFIAKTKGAMATRAPAGGHIMHYLIRVPRAPAAHMVSGTPDSPALRKFQEVTKQPMGTPGVGFAPACNPRLQTNRQHRGSGEHWELLAVVNGEVCIGPFACEACMATKEWQEAYQNFIAENGAAHPHAMQHDSVGAVQAGGCC